MKSTYNYNKNYFKCKRCDKDYTFKPDECFWDEKGFSTSTKLCKCGHCGTINVVKYVIDYGFENMNYDRRLYYK